MSAETHDTSYPHLGRRVIPLKIFITYYLCFRLGWKVQLVHHERCGTLGIAMGGESLRMYNQRVNDRYVQCANETYDIKKYEVENHNGLDS